MTNENIPPVDIRRMAESLETSIAGLAQFMELSLTDQIKALNLLARKENASDPVRQFITGFLGTHFGSVQGLSVKECFAEILHKLGIDPDARKAG